MAGIVFNPNKPENLNSDDTLQSQIDNLQTTLASLNQKVFSLQETVAQKDKEIADLKKQLEQKNLSAVSSSDVTETKPRTDETLTIVSALINLFNFLLPPPRKETTV